MLKVHSTKIAATEKFERVLDVLLQSVEARRTLHLPKRDLPIRGYISSYFKWVPINDLVELASCSRSNFVSRLQVLGICVINRCHHVWCLPQLFCASENLNLSFHLQTEQPPVLP
jgi:hypothetical protein